LVNLLVEGIGGNTLTVQQWSECLMGRGQVELAALYTSIVAKAERLRSGDLSGAEGVLTAEAVSLDVMFANLAHRAHLAESVDHFDRFMRLALKAQSQCRATIETLALMKNPPVFARQANISSGSQLVNNAIVSNGVARAEISEFRPNRLLGGYGERMDGDTASETGPSDSAVETMGAIDGSADSRREGARIPKRL